MQGRGGYGFSTDITDDGAFGRGHDDTLIYVYMLGFLILGDLEDPVRSSRPVGWRFSTVFLVYVLIGLDFATVYLC